MLLLGFCAANGAAVSTDPKTTSTDPKTEINLVCADMCCYRCWRSPLPSAMVLLQIRFGGVVLMFVVDNQGSFICVSQCSRFPSTECYKDVARSQRGHKDHRSKLSIVFGEYGEKDWDTSVKKVDYALRSRKNGTAKFRAWHSPPAYTNSLPRL